MPPPTCLCLSPPTGKQRVPRGIDPAVLTRETGEDTECSAWLYTRGHLFVCSGGDDEVKGSSCVLPPPFFFPPSILEVFTSPSFHKCFSQRTCSGLPPSKHRERPLPASLRSSMPPLLFPLPANCPVPPTFHPSLCLNSPLRCAGCPPPGPRGHGNTNKGPSSVSVRWQDLLCLCFFLFSFNIFDFILGGGGDAEGRPGDTGQMFYPEILRGLYDLTDGYFLVTVY